LICFLITIIIIIKDTFSDAIYFLQIIIGPLSSFFIEKYDLENVLVGCIVTLFVAILIFASAIKLNKITKIVSLFGVILWYFLGLMNLYSPV
jgi:hypothetical protein